MPAGPHTIIFNYLDLEIVG